MSAALLTVIPASGETIDFAGAWSKLWTAIMSATGIAGIMTVLTIAGALIALFAIGKYLFQQRKSGGQGAGHGLGQIGWALPVALLLMAPNLLIPLALKVVDVIGNVIVNVVKLAV